MTSPATPTWRQFYDRVESVVTPAAESLVRTTGFSRAVAALARLNALSRTTSRSLSARWWHQMNLPAATDVARLRRELGALDREVRRLALELERRRREDAAYADRSSTGGSARACPPGHSAQRPPSP